MLLPVLQHYWKALLLNAFPTTEYKYSNLRLFIFLPTRISGILFLSFREMSIPYKPLSWSFTISEGLLKKSSEKPNSDYYEEIQSFSKKHLVPDFLLRIFLTQVQIKLIEVFYFTSTVIWKLETPFDSFVFAIFFHEFDHMLFNALGIETELLKLWLKWSIRDLTLQSLSLFLSFVLSGKFCKMSSNLNLAIKFLIPPLPMICSHSS